MGTQSTGVGMGVIWEVPEDESASDRMCRIFEEEMRLGPNLNNHIPNFIAQGQNVEQLQNSWIRDLRVECPDKEVNPKHWLIIGDSSATI